MNGENTRTLPKLWQEYFYLTREMAKFLTKQEFELFEEIMRQREKLQESIDSFSDDEYRLSAQGQQLIKNIIDENDAVMRRLEFLRNAAKRQQTASSAYEGYNQGVVGGWMDRKS